MKKYLSLEYALSNAVILLLMWVHIFSVSTFAYQSTESYTVFIWAVFLFMAIYILSMISISFASRDLIQKVKSISYYRLVRMKESTFSITIIWYLLWAVVLFLAKSWIVAKVFPVNSDSYNTGIGFMTWLSFILVPLGILQWYRAYYQAMGHSKSDVICQTFVGVVFGIIAFLFIYNRKEISFPVYYWTISIAIVAEIAYYYYLEKDEYQNIKEKSKPSDKTGITIPRVFMQMINSIYSNILMFLSMFIGAAYFLYQFYVRIGVDTFVSYFSYKGIIVVLLLFLFIYYVQKNYDEFSLTNEGVSRYLKQSILWPSVIILPLVFTWIMFWKGNLWLSFVLVMWLFLLAMIFVNYTLFYQAHLLKTYSLYCLVGNIIGIVLYIFFGKNGSIGMLYLFTLLSDLIILFLAFEKMSNKYDLTVFDVVIPFLMLCVAVCCMNGLIAPINAFILPRFEEMDAVLKWAPRVELVAGFLVYIGLLRLYKFKESYLS